MITLGVYGYKKYQKRRDKKKLNQNIGEVPPVIDQSAEFAQSPTSPAPGRPAEGGPVSYAESRSSLYSGTTSEPSSAVEPGSAVARQSLEYTPSSTWSSTSSEYQAYQQYVERQSNSILRDKPDQPPTYQAALSPPPEQPAGTWIFVPAGGQVPFANGLPANPLPPSPIPAKPQHAPLANQLPGSLSPTAYAKSTSSELPADIPMTMERKAAPAKQGKTPRFELAAHEVLSPSRASRQSDSDEESMKSVEMKRFELA